MILINGVTRRFDGGDGVFGLDIDIGMGEIIVLSGPSGSGKTTLLRLIAGLEVPDEGSIHIGKEEMSGPGWAVSPHKRGISMAFQSPALFPHMTLAENIRFALHDLPKEQRDQRITELLTLTGIIHCADRLPDQVSGGEAKRCGLARALAPRNPLLLLDEPLTHLDPGLREKMIRLIQSYHDETGACIVYVTHHPDESDILRGRDIIMENGRIIL